MRRDAIPSTATLGSVLAFMLHPAPAQAQLAKTWVASNGGGTACSRAAPCLTFEAAYGITAAGGEINCVDSSDYGPVTITKSISIVCDNTQAGISMISGVAIIINGGDIVTLKGLSLEGNGTSAVGINILSATTVHVQKLQISGFRSNSGAGIFFQPPAYAELYVTDSYITDNGNPVQTVTGGIVARPFSAGSANVSINRVRLENNHNGILIDGRNSTGVAVNATVTDTLVAGSANNGIQAISAVGKAAARIFLDRGAISGNFASGVNANGSTASGAGSAFARISDSNIALNVTGVSTTAAGVVESFKNNRISGNQTDGTPLPAFPGPGGTPLQ